MKIRRSRPGEPRMSLRRPAAVSPCSDTLPDRNTSMFMLMWLSWISTAWARAMRAWNTWVTRITVRLGKRSARTPPKGDSTILGMPIERVTQPRATAVPVILYTDIRGLLAAFALPSMRLSYRSIDRSNCGPRETQKSSWLQPRLLED